MPSGNYIVAVSGGIDSVCLLHMLSKLKHPLIIAHVDHGIRGEDSAADARFVEGLARFYKLPFVMRQLKLGAKASEETARNGRYAFLRELAQMHNATIVTAHHKDDLIETIAINYQRGTGWRGLAVFDTPGIERPLLGMTKAFLYEYAARHRLEWVEDVTNSTDAYQRNRVRRQLHRKLLPREQNDIVLRRTEQLQLKHDIVRETTRLLARHAGSRHFYTQIDTVAAGELLGAQIEKEGVQRPTRPQLMRAVQAIKTALPGSIYQVGSGVELHFTSRKFTVSVV